MSIESRETRARIARTTAMENLIRRGKAGNTLGIGAKPSVRPDRRSEAPSGGFSLISSAKADDGKAARTGAGVAPAADASKIVGALAGGAGVGFGAGMIRQGVNTIKYPSFMGMGGRAGALAKIIGGAALAAGGASVAMASLGGKAKADEGKAAAAPLNTSPGVPGIRGAEFMTHTPKAQAYSDRMGDPLYRYAIAKSAAQGDAAARAIQAGQPPRPMINGAKAAAPSDGAFIDRAAQIAAQNAVAQKGPSAPIGASAPSGPAQRSSYTTVDGRTVEATEAQARAWGARRN